MYYDNKGAKTKVPAVKVVMNIRVMDNIDYSKKYVQARGGCREP
jgi:hypothetical protein